MVDRQRFVFGDSSQNDLTDEVQDSRSLAFERRKQYYDLIHQVISKLEQASTQGPQMIDGQYTVAAKRRSEAYEVIDTSEDEAFQTDLYDWYLSQGSPERLLEIQSPYIVAYLQRKSSTDLAHADLLWKYHNQHGNNHEAAVVQLEQARSEFLLSLDRRIEYLGRSKANASTNSPGVPRHTRYKLLREVSDMLDVANIQSDLLQRLREDKRITSERRPAIIEELNGRLLGFDIVSLFPSFYYFIYISSPRLIKSHSYTIATPTRRATSTCAS